MANAKIENTPLREPPPKRVLLNLSLAEAAVLEGLLYNVKGTSSFSSRCRDIYYALYVLPFKDSGPRWLHPVDFDGDSFYRYDNPTVRAEVIDET